MTVYEPLKQVFDLRSYLAGCALSGLLAGAGINCNPDDQRRRRRMAVAEALASADELLAALGQGPGRDGDIIDLDRRPPAA
jgi:hypothetical protein